MTAVAATTLVDDRHVRPGAYIATITDDLLYVVDRRMEAGRPVALCEDVKTPTRRERYLDTVEVAQRPLKWRACRLTSGELVDADADTRVAWIPVAELVGMELVRAPEGVGLSSFPR